MKKYKKVLGLNIGHDGGCSLCINGEIVCSMQEERLNRMKNSYGWLNSLKFCLENANLKLEDIDLVVFSDYNDKVIDGFDGGLSLFGFPKEKCVKADHHLSHASSTFFTSGFEESLIYILDGRGNNNTTESIYVGKGTKIKKISGNNSGNYMRGFIAAYQAFTSYFGWHQDEAGKTMGLAPYGNPDRYSEYKIFEETQDGWYINKLENNTALGLEKFCKENSITVPPKFSTKSMEYADMAAWIQKEFEDVSLKIIKRIQQETGIKNLCMAGGGALNSVINTKILNNTDIENLFIFPASGDSGQSIGNALYGYYILGENERNLDYIWKNDYRKVAYTNDETEKILRRTNEIADLIIPKSPRFSYEKINNITEVVAKLLSEENIIGWFQEGSEMGPRALGHRSILCDARPKDMKDKLNNRVKHRESFRPFAASVLAEKSPEYFEFEKPSPFMLLVVNVREKYRNLIPAITHIDGTCRIQTLTKEDNGIYFDLVTEFDRITGLPLILNTSFNLAGEPIVETPMDALKCFLRTEMDYLVINDYLIRKVSNV